MTDDLRPRAGLTEADFAAMVEEDFPDEVAWHRAEAVAADRERIAAAVRVVTQNGERFQSCGGHGCGSERADDASAVLAIVNPDPKEDR